LNSPTPQLPILKFDFHLHTLDDPYDQHIYHTVFELLDKAAALGYGALAITLHNRQFKSGKAEAYARERGILLIPGVERNVGKAHVLMINFPSEISDAVHDFADLRRAKDACPSGLIIAAHPFYPSSVALQENFLRHKELFDAVEVSGFYHKLWNPNLKAIESAARFGLPLIGNSDTHTLEQFGTTWSEARCERNADSIVAAVKAGKAAVKGRALAWHELGLIGWKVVARGYMKWINYKRTRGYQPAP
jgi:predicted metal-dependent phosphoesterase TrpH